MARVKRTKTDIINDTDLLLCCLRQGHAAFDPGTAELRFNGLRYSTSGLELTGGWCDLLDVIGREKLHAALRSGAVRTTTATGHIP